MTSRMALTTTVAQRLVLALLTPLVNWAVTLALMGSLAGDGFIGSLLPVSAEPEWVRADGSMKDTEEVGCWPTPSMSRGGLPPPQLGGPDMGHSGGPPGSLCPPFLA